MIFTKLQNGTSIRSPNSTSVRNIIYLLLRKPGTSIWIYISYIYYFISKLVLYEMYVFHNNATDCTTNT